MEEFTLSELGVFLGVVGGIMTSVLLTIQKSKCKNIKCCGCECDRDPTLPSDDGVESTQPWPRVVYSKHLNTSHQGERVTWSNWEGATIVERSQARRQDSWVSVRFRESDKGKDDQKLNDLQLWRAVDGVQLPVAVWDGCVRVQRSMSCKPVPTPI